MNKTAIAFLTKDRPELSAQSIVPLLKGAFDLFWIDGSDTQEGIDASLKFAYPRAYTINNVRGGAGAAIVFALTTMLAREENYDYVGLCEADVLLGENAIATALGLFERGRSDGLEVGAVSARAYVDRVLFQREGYAVCHNLGAGQIIFTREAAQLVLKTFRTAWTADNRRIFSQLAGIDIGTYWAFRLNEHPLTADFHWEAALHSRGLASLALTPSPVEMIGQDPPLVEQGLTIAQEPVAERIDNAGFERYRERLQAVREGQLQLGIDTQFQFDPNTGTWTYFPHQMHMLGGRYSGDWRFEECRGFGTFKWVAGDDGIPTRVAYTDAPILEVPVFGPCTVLISGGKTGGTVEVFDTQSGFRAAPQLPPEGEQGQVLQMQVPSGLSLRDLHITALTPGATFYGIQTREKQSFDPSATFDHSVLPCPAP